MLNKISYSQEVIDAKAKNLPIVALESTIISHGMPYPTNLEVAKKCEAIVRENGAIPATIAVINGIIKIGLNKDELEFLAKSDDVLKLSRADLAYAISQKKSGSTTVAATMILAKLGGIDVFATGGIGGVHRGVSETWDISCDLEELANTDVCVVCAGAKAILDLPKTLEYLETKGVSVIGYKTKELPAFYTKDSGISVPLTLNSPQEIAEMLKVKKELGITNGSLVTNPIPECYSLDSEMINKAVQEALESAKEKEIKGKQVTPFLLSKITEITKGTSLNANQQLVYNNCKLAAQIAWWLKK